MEGGQHRIEEVFRNPPKSQEKLWQEDEWVLPLCVTDRDVSLVFEGRWVGWLVPPWWELSLVLLPESPEQLLGGFEPKLGQRPAGTTLDLQPSTTA